MAGWEIALLIVALTFMMVNIVSVVVQLVVLVKYSGIITKSIAIMEELMDKTGRMIDEMFKEL